MPSLNSSTDADILPYLPPEHINRIFTSLDHKATTSRLHNLLFIHLASKKHLVCNMMIIFSLYTRTNNDAEGWNLRMNNKAKKGQLSFYMLIHLLHEEAVQGKIHFSLVSENKLTYQECHKYHKYSLLSST